MLTTMASRERTLGSRLTKRRRLDVSLGPRLGPTIAWRVGSSALVQLFLVGEGLALEDRLDNVGGRIRAQ